SLKVFIYGKDKNLFYKLLNKKVEIEIGNTLRDILLSISRNIKKTKYKLTIIFSPAAASFDQFKNFEHRGKVFNKLVKKYLIN
ncbi:UDP-N-acetylmuramoyl-L-alanine--D-glutamate ligase, partial [Candidatus Pelagibacter sp.]|nr:UDP-N-acetylmuramoyl-L-alanine--D-glutamate ligase [Candidatus Pelagibacter sp.]